MGPDQAVTPIQLTGNVRQRHDWERQALAAVRDGDMLDAVDAYAAHDRLHLAETPADVCQQIVTDFLASRAAEPAGAVLLLTSRRADARALNTAVRDALRAAGQLGAGELTVSVPAGRQLCLSVGDEVVVTVNDYRRGLFNGTRGTVTALGTDGVEITAHQDGMTHQLPAGWLAAGTVEHGYALTCHRAQGITVDHALVYATGALSREAGYVALSRGRHTNHLYSTWELLQPGTDTDAHQPAADTPDLDEHVDACRGALVERLETRRAQHTASSQLNPPALPPPVSPRPVLRPAVGGPELF